MPETDLVPGTFSMCKKRVLHAQLLLREPEKTDPGLQNDKTSHLIIGPNSFIFPQVLRTNFYL